MREETEEVNENIAWLIRLDCMRQTEDINTTDNEDCSTPTMQSTSKSQAIQVHNPDPAARQIQ